jgi:High potential iron-sulfur protein
MADKISRRAMLMRGLQVPVGGALLWGLSGCSGGSGGSGSTASASACADPSTMSDAEMGTRKSLSYTEKSENPQQVCAGCSFFHAGSGSCGTCDMMSGGPVNPQGHCTSWNAKPA